MKYTMQFSINGPLEDEIEKHNKNILVTYDGDGCFQDPDDLFLGNLGNGMLAIDMNSGTIVTREKGYLKIVGSDPDWKGMYDRYQKALGYKDSTAFKIIERSSKAAVWARAASYLKDAIKNNSIEHTLKFFESKADSHREYLSTQSVEYNFATQNFTPKEKV
jgi:hypothetical protein